MNAAERQLEELAAIADLRTHGELTARLGRILARAQAQSGAACSQIHLCGDGMRILHLTAHQGACRSLVHRFGRIVASEDTLHGTALARREGISISPLGEESEFGAGVAAAREVGFRAMQVYPLLARFDAPVGTLSSFFDRERALGEAEDRLAQAHTRSIVQAIETCLGSLPSLG